jgi:hypothetical protein
MIPTQLLPGEHVITHSPDGQATLTSHRIRFRDSVTGRVRITSIMLDNLASVDVNYRSLVIMLYLAILFFCVSMISIISGYNNNDTGVKEISLGSFGISLLCVLLYWISRRHTISLASKGGASIHIRVRGADEVDIVDFVDKVEEMVELRRKPNFVATPD